MTASTRASTSSDGVRDPASAGGGDVAVQPEPVSQRIVFFDSDTTYRAALAECLRIEGLEVAEFDDPEAALEEIAASPDLGAALIAVEMFGGDSGHLKDHLQEAISIVPVALITHTRTNRDEEAALKLGVAEFLDKSSSPTIIAQRLRLLFGGGRTTVPVSAEGSADVLDVGPLTLRLNSCRALWRGVEAPLTVTEFRIVRLLAAEAGQQFSYREIYDVVHGEDFMAGDGPDGHRTNVRSLIRKIRKRFRQLDPDFEAIENCAGYGYRWRADDGDDAVPLDELDGLPGVVEQASPNEVMTRTGSEE